MSLMKFHYGDLEAAAKKARRAADQLGDYADSIETHVTDRLSALPGSDSAGHISSAASLARSRMTALNGLADQYIHLSQDITSLVDLAQDKDSDAAAKINTIVDEYVGKRSWYQKAQDYFADLYIDLMNGNPLFRNIKNYLDRGAYHVGNACESIYNFFKYGDGPLKYIVDSVLAVAEFLVAVVLVISALTVTALTGPALALLVVACCVYLVCKAVNMEASLQSKMDALTEYNENPSLARHHAKADSVKERVETQDYGGQSANDCMHGVGVGIDVAETVSGIYIAVSQLYTKLVDVKVINPKSARFGQHIRYQPTKNVVVNNIKSEMGFDRYTGKWSLKQMLKPDLSLGTSKLSSLEGGGPLLKMIYGSALVVDTLDGYVSDCSTLVDFSKDPKLEDLDDAVESGISLGSELPVLDMPKKLITDPVFKFKKLVEAFE